MIILIYNRIIAVKIKPNHRMKIKNRGIMSYELWVVGTEIDITIDIDIAIEIDIDIFYQLND